MIYSCAFTGHRPSRLPWRYNEDDPRCKTLKMVLNTQIHELAEAGTTSFLSGMAQGVDLWSAQIVLGLREENSSIKLHCILPCEGQERKWSVSAQELYRSILNRADNVVFVDREYRQESMLKRNRDLVDHSSTLLAVYNGQYRSGTAMTVRYAQSKGRKIIMIDPLLRNISHQGFK